MKQFVLIIMILSLLAAQSIPALCFPTKGYDIASPGNASERTDEILMETLPPILDTTDLSGGIITGFHYENIFASFQRELYPQGELEELYDLLDLIDAVLYCTVALPDGNEVESVCVATWNTEELTLDTPGLYDITATLTPPEGCTFGDGVRTQIVVPVQIAGTATPGQITSIKSWRPYTVSIAVAQGDSLESVIESPLLLDYTKEALSCKDEHGTTYLADILWDFTPLDLNTPGLYTITGTPIPPKGTVFAENLTLPQPTATISVQAEDKPDLNCFYLLYPDVWFPWIAPSAGLEHTTVWISEEEGTWAELTGTGCGQVLQDRIGICMSTFTKGNRYRVQVDYTGGQTGILSFLWDDSIIIDGYWEGDRDGNDNDDDTLDPPLVQPPPRPPVTLPPPLPPETLPPETLPPEPLPPTEDSDDSGSNSSSKPSPSPSVPGLQPPSTPSDESTVESEASPVPESPTAEYPTPAKPVDSKPMDKTAWQSYEHMDGDTLTISGARILWLLEQNTRFVPFGWNEISLEVPAAFLKELSLASEDMFSLTLVREQDLAFTLSISVNGEMVTELESTIVRLLAPKPQHTYTLSLADNILETPVAYEHGTAVFSITQTGTYQLTDEAIPMSGTFQSQPARSDEVPPVLPEPTSDDVLPLTVTVIALLLGVGFWLWRKRR